MIFIHFSLIEMSSVSIRLQLTLIADQPGLFMNTCYVVRSSSPASFGLERLATELMENSDLCELMSIHHTPRMSGAQIYLCICN